MNAAQNGYITIVKYLVKQVGVNVDSKDNVSHMYKVILNFNYTC